MVLDSTGMLRILSILLVVLVLPQAIGMPVFATQDGCAESCPGEEPGGHCPPDCAWCACCPYRSVAVECIRMPLPPEWRGARLEAAVPLFSMTDPHEIYHVPRPLA
jgi:hypothetical protein